MDIIKRAVAAVWFTIKNMTVIVILRRMLVIRPQGLVFCSCLSVFFRWACQKYIRCWDLAELDEPLSHLRDPSPKFYNFDAVFIPCHLISNCSKHQWLSYILPVFGPLQFTQLWEQGPLLSSSVHGTTILWFMAFCVVTGHADENGVGQNARQEAES